MDPEIKLVLPSEWINNYVIDPWSEARCRVCGGGGGVRTPCRDAGQQAPLCTCASHGAVSMLRSACVHASLCTCASHGASSMLRCQPAGTLMHLCVARCVKPTVRRLCRSRAARRSGGSLGGSGGRAGKARPWGVLRAPSAPVLRRQFRGRRGIRCGPTDN